MLYPNAPADSSLKGTAFSFSTTFMERGEHSGTDARIETAAAEQLRPRETWDHRKTVPLLPRQSAAEALEAFNAPPLFDALPVIDLLHKRADSVAALVTKGHAWVRGRADAAAARRHGLPLGADEDSRPHVQQPGERVPTAEEYRRLAELWLQPRAPNSVGGGRKAM